MDIRNCLNPVRKLPLNRVNLNAIPEVATVRPRRCPHCEAPALQGGRIVLQGHGQRVRGVVVLRCDDEGARFELSQCWARRFLCRACRRSCVVLPEGVLQGHLYSLAALVAAWWALSATMTAGEPRAAVCAPVGADREEGAVGPARRWRSPYRWSRLISHLWPSRPQLGGWRAQVEGLLISTVGAAHSLRPEILARWLVGAHTWSGAVM